MKKTIGIGFWVVLAFIFNAATAQAGSGMINWQPYPDGIEAARHQGKKVYLYFKSRRCPFCVKMDRMTFADPEVADYLNDHFIAIQVNGDKDFELVEKYKVQGYPDNRFFDGNQEPVFQFFGFYQPPAFMILLKYVQTESYKIMDPMQFYKSLKKE